MEAKTAKFHFTYDKDGGNNSYLSNSKKILFQTKNSKMCSSREDKGISPALKITDKRSRALIFIRRSSNLSSNGTRTGKGSKSTKVKLGTTKSSRSGSEYNAVKGLHFKSLSLKRRIFQQKSLWKEMTTHRFEGSDLVQPLLTLQDLHTTWSLCWKKGITRAKQTWRMHTSVFLYTKSHEN